MTYWNYCDYRCGDCERSFECPVAIKKREQEMRAVAEGRDFDSMDAVKESLEETLEMVKKMAEERGVDLADETGKRRIGERVIMDHPLVKKSKRFAIDVMSFAKEMEDRAFSEETQKAIYDLCWYAGLLSAKLYRCLSGKYEAMEEDDTELKELDMEDANKTASVVIMAISKCKKALDSLLLEHLSEAQRFYTDLKDIEKGFKTEFPEIEVTAGKQLH
ncbi:MAG: hypothetical protein HY026_04465 [Deltaproteobacteria bacterium]|nr:hypothetical protein [Deltaproteobacteria bacterium]